MKRIAILAFSVLLSIVGFGQTTLSAGDVVVTGYNTRDLPNNVATNVGTEFSFVILTSVEANTEIRFTDRGWLETNAFRAGNNGQEGVIVWTTNVSLPCGTQVIIDSPNNGTSSATIGTISNDIDDFELRAAGDQILVYQGDESNPTLLYGLNYNNSGGANIGWRNPGQGVNPTQSFVPQGLIDGTNAVDVSNDDDQLTGIYDCSVTLDPAAILASVSNPANWILSTTSNNSVLGNCIFLSSTWDGTNWSNGIPNDTSTNAIIDGNYNTGVGSLDQNSFTACTLTVNVGATLNIDNSTFLKIDGNVTVNGTLTVQSQGNFIQNDDASSFINNGTSEVLKVTPVKLDWFFYTYWSSPVSGLIVDDIFAIPTGDRVLRFGWDAANYQDIIINATGVAGADGIDDDNNAFVALNGTDPLTPGIGYAITEAENLFFGPATFQRTFSGTFNNGVVSVPIFNDPATVDPVNNGAHYNFLGNPYPSAISFNDFQAANSTTIGPLVYYWSQASPPDEGNAGNQGVNFSQNDYAIYMVSMGTGTAGASGVIPNEFIPSGQGFFVPSVGAGTATFNNSMRSNATSTGSNDIFFGIEDNDVNFNKSTTSNENTSNLNNRNLLWLNLTSNNGIFNQVLIGYVDGATDANDGITYEATRILPFEPTGIIYTFIDGENTKLAIQGKDPNGLNETEIISLGFDTDIDPSENTTYTLSVAQFEGGFFDTATVFLIDNLLNITHNLSISDYNFNSEVGEFLDRFEIRFEDVTLSSDDFEVVENILTVFELDNGDLQFRVSNNLQMETVQIISLSGQILYTLDAEGSQNSYSLNLTPTVYIAQIQLTDGRLISKKVLKRN